MINDATDLSRNQVITAFFDDRSHAEQAAGDLAALGIPRDKINLTGSDEMAATNETAATPADGKGFWDSLKNLFLPDEDRKVYAEGLHRGGYLISIHDDSARHKEIMDILDRDGTVNMDDREAQWRSEGWTGSYHNAASAESDRTASNPAVQNRLTETDVEPSRLPQTTSLNASASPKIPAQTRDEKIPVYEENLQVGKRDVSHGRVRLRSYVVETPVSEQVSLHQDKIGIEHVPVDRPVGPGEALFQNRTIEAEERAEEAVVGKEARVKEEIILHKSAEDRVQTVNDTVRHTQVDVDDGREGRSGSAVSQFADAIDKSQIIEHMDVIAADGTKVGTVDHLEGTETIKLAKNTAPDGQHHFIPLDWVDHVDKHVHLKKSSADTRANW